MYNSKECLSCGVEKDGSCFHKDNGKKDGLKNKCKVCMSLVLKERYKEKAESLKAYTRQYYKNNKEVLWEKHKGKIKSRLKEWLLLNRDKVNANAAKTRVVRLNRFNIILSREEKTHIECLYSLARMRSKHSGEKWHVDHIVPLKGKTISGLHVYSNLRVIPAAMNLAKGNKFNG